MKTKNLSTCSTVSFSIACIVINFSLRNKSNVIHEYSSHKPSAYCRVLASGAGSYVIKHRATTGITPIDILKCMEPGSVKCSKRLVIKWHNRRVGRKLTLWPQEGCAPPWGFFFNFKHSKTRYSSEFMFYLNVFI